MRAVGFRWWFLPKSLALAGEFEHRITETYTSAHANSRTETITTATSYTSTAVKTISVGSGTWTLDAGRHDLHLRPGSRRVLLADRHQGQSGAWILDAF